MVYLLLSEERLILGESGRAITPFGGVAAFVAYLRKVPRYREPATLRSQVLTCGAILGRAGRRLVVHLRFAILNFAEVGFRCRHLISPPAKKACLSNLTSEFRFKDFSGSSKAAEHAARGPAAL